MSKRGYGRIIRDARLGAHMSQEDLAQRMAVSPSTVSNLERERLQPRVPEQVNALCDILPITREQLLMAMGVRLRPAPSTRLPQQLVDRLLLLSPERVQSLIELLPPPPNDGESPAGMARK